MIILSVLETTFDKVQIVINNTSKLIDDLHVQIDVVQSKRYQGHTFNTIQDIDMLQTDAVIELHLMADAPMEYLNKKVENVSKICSQIETLEDPLTFINKAKGLKYKVGLSVELDTNIERLNEFVPYLDFVQFMCIEPGKQGQPFNQNVLRKIYKFKQQFPNVRIQVDGGVNENTIRKLKDAGADDFIIGSALLKSSNIKQKYVELANMASTKQNNASAIHSIAHDKKIQKVAILGGAAWQEHYQVYKDAFEVSKALAEAGYEIVNGGGPGVMRASTKGAHAGGGHVLAITYHPNKPKRHYEGVDLENDFDDEVITLDYFDRTKVMLQTTQAHVVFEGSLGTFSELGMTWISSWIHHPNIKPIILYGAFWNEYLTMITKYSLVGDEEKSMIKVCTTPQQVVDVLRDFE